MKKLILFLTLSLVSMVSAMELNLDQIPESEFITFEMPNNKTEKIQKKFVMLSSTLKEMIEDLGPKETLPVPQPIAESLDLIKPYFKWAYMDFAQSINQEEEKLEFLRKKLEEHTDQELIEIQNAFNYLNIPVIYNNASEILTQRMCNDNRTNQYLENGSPLMPTVNNDMAKLSAQKMLKKNPDVKAYWLLQESMQSPQGKTKIIPTQEWYLGCINTQATLSANSYENSIALFDLQSGKKLSQILSGQHNAYARGMCFSPDGRLLAVGNDAGQVYLWDVRSPKQLLLSTHSQSSYSVPGILQGDRPVNAISFSADGSLLAFEGNQKIYLYNFAKQEFTTISVPSPNSIIRKLCFNKTNTLLAASCDDIQNFSNQIMVYDIITDTFIESLPTLNSIRALQFSKDNHLVSVSEITESKPKKLFKCCIEHWNITNTNTNQISKQKILNCIPVGFNAETRFTKMCLNQNATLVAITKDDNTISLFCTETGKKIADLATNAYSIFDLKFNSEVPMIICGTWQSPTFDNLALHLLPIIKPESQLQKWFKQDIKPEQVILLDEIRNLRALQSRRLTFDLKSLQLQINKCMFPFDLRKIIGQTSVWEKTQERWNNLSRLTRTGIAASTAGLAGYLAYFYCNKNK